MSDRAQLIWFFGFGLVFLPVFIGIAIAIIIDPADDSNKPRTPTRSLYTSAISTPESESRRLARLERESAEILDWILNSTDSLSRCVASGRTDWGLRGTQLELFALTLEGAGRDWLDGR